MRIDSIPQLLRDSQRLHEIIATFAKYGLADWLSNVKLPWLQRHFQSKCGAQISGMSEGEKLRMAMTELGTTFIKLGQILSTRPDLVGPEVTVELAKLQSSTPADPPEKVREIFQNELDSTPEELFDEFDATAAASASIGQIHFAKLKDGTRVVVKIQHADIESKVRSDLEIMKALAAIAEQYSEEAKRYRPVDTMDEFARTLMAELDYTRERRNLEQFRKNFDGEKDVVIPCPYIEFSTSRVLTMDRLDGISLADTDLLVEKGYDLDLLAHRGADIFLEMIFRDGFYHADPHPGNLFAVANSSIGLLDCGMVGRIDEKLREQFEDLLIAAVSRDNVALCDAICYLGSVPPRTGY
jgi:ubiquinone biosynthesis protein